MYTQYQQDSTKITKNYFVFWIQYKNSRKSVPLKLNLGLPDNRHSYKISCSSSVMIGRQRVLWGRGEVEGCNNISIAIIHRFLVYQSFVYYIDIWRTHQHIFCTFLVHSAYQVRKCKKILCSTYLHSLKCI